MKRVITEDGGYWEDDKTWVQPVPGTSIVPELRAEITRLTAERDAAIAERDEAKAVAVWAANRELRVIGPIESGNTYLVGVGVRELVDGTDDSLYRALAEAMKGGRDGLG